ncbi:MAG: alkaline phosphatase D family protein [Pseudomonadota bacterium]
MTDVSRRQALTLAAATLAATRVAESSDSTVTEGSARFRHGVASGDPDRSSVVIWTRVSGLAGPEAVQWEVAKDRSFREIVSQGSMPVSAIRDYTAKVLVTGLTAGSTYFYRYALGTEQSETGTTRTLPAGEVASLTMAVASCSNFPFGFFNAYESIARDNSIDWVLHLGDYIYEYGPDGFGGEVGKLLGREHEPRHETVSLADYRRRHAQYKADPQSQAMHAAKPLLAIWDDHEATNNPWTGGAENHQSDSEGDWQTRRDAALQAYFEWMPVRDPAPGHRRSDYWRHWRFGSLASLISLETRHSGRAEQISYFDHLNRLEDPEAAQEFLRTIVGAPDRAMLSTAMESFLRESLSESTNAGRPWRLIANQIPMARTLNPRISVEDLDTLGRDLSEKSRKRINYMYQLGQLGMPLYLDPWDGYPVARQKFYELCKRAGATDLVVLTGDSHSFWSNQLFDDRGQRMGVELGTTGITSPGDFLEFGAAGAEFMDKALVATNPEILWTDCRHTGYLRLRLDQQGGLAEYMSCPLDRANKRSVKTIKSMQIARSNGAVELVETT